MRCDCCNKNLSDYEATLRHAVTNEFINTCNKCLEGLDIPVRGRPDLNPFESIEDEIEDSFIDEDFLNED